MSNKKYSTKLYFKKFTDDQIVKRLKKADKGNLECYLEVIVHNQNVLEMEIHRIYKELVALKKGSNVEISNTNSEKKITVELGNEKTGEAMRRARGGAM